MPKQMVWDRRYLRLAREIASWGKDPSTKCGAVLVDDQHICLATGFNGFASGVADTEERLTDRPTKLRLTIHAEENAILSAGKAGRTLRGATCYVWPMAPCASCASKLVQAGIKTVVTIRAEEAQESRWGEDMLLAQQVYDETDTAFVAYGQEFLD